MSDQIANIKVNVDGSSAKTGINEIKDAVHGLAVEAGKASDATGKIGKGADTEKAVAATKRFEDQLKRLNLELESGGKNTAAYIEGRAKAAGADTAALAPLLAQYDQLKAKQALANAEFTKAGKVMTEYGMGVKATSAALRQVPAQFTDIIVSLQGGQAPLTVLLQQGGQLKDVFGGVGNAAKALGGYILGLINPWTLAAGAAALLATAYTKGAAEAEGYNKALIMTGNYAGTTATQMTGMAQAISKATGGTVGSAAEAMTALANTGSISAQQFDKLGASTAQWAKATGQSVSEVAKQFAKLAEDPLKASVALNEAQHYLTRTIYDQIKALTDQGRMLEAGVVAQNAWSDAINQRAPLLIENLGWIEKAWRDVMGAAKGAWDSMLSIGRQADPVVALRGAIANAEWKLADTQKNRAYNPGGADAETIRINKVLSSLREQLVLAEKGAGYEAQSAAYQREEAKAAEAKIAWDKEHDKYLSKQVQMQREITAAQNKYNALKPEDQNPQQLAATIKGIQDRFKEATKNGPKIGRDPWDKSVADAYVKSMEAMEKIQLSASGAADTLSKSQLALRDVQASPQWAKFNRQQQEQVIYAASLSQAEEDRAAATKAATKALENATAASHKYYADLANNNDSLEKANDKLREETALLGVSEEVKGQLTVSRLQSALAIEQEAFAMLNLQNSSEIEISTARKRLDLLKEQLSLTGANVAAKAAIEWKKTADSIRDNLTDAFISAIDNGKSLFVNLRDSVVNMFKNMVLRPVVQGIMQPIAGAVTSSLIGTTANAASGILGTAGNAASLASVGSAFTGAFSAGAAIGTEAFGAGMTMMAEASGLSSFMAGAGQALGAIGPAGWAALAAIAVLSMGPSFVSASDSGRAKIDYTAAGIGGAAYNTTGDSSQIAAATLNTNSLAKSYYEAAAALGAKAVASVFEFGTNTGKEGANPMTVLGVNAGSASYSSGEIASGDTAALQLASSRAILTALQASEMPKYLAGVFDGITAGTATQEQITAALTGASALATFNKELQALPFSKLADLSYAATQALIGFSGGLDALKSNLSAYYANFYTAEEQRAQTISNINKTVGLSGFDAATATRESFRALVESQDLTTESGRKTYAALLSVNDAFAGLTPVLESTATAVKDLQSAAMTAVTKAVDAAKDAATKAYDTQAAAIQAALDPVAESIGKLQTLSDTLKSTLDGMRISGSDGAYRAQAQAQISAALATARAGGPLPLDGQLNSALGTVSKPSEALFATYEAYARDFYRTANDIAALSDITVKQLTADEITQSLLKKQLEQAKTDFDTTLEYLDAQAEMAQQMLDVANGTYTATLSVADAVAALVNVLTPKTTTTGTTATGAKANFSVDQYGTGGSGTKTEGTYYAPGTTYGITNPIVVDRLNAINDFADNLNFGGADKQSSVAALYAQAQDQNWSSSMIAAATGYSTEDIRKLWEEAGLPSFAVGTNRIPRDMIAQVHEGEAIVPAAYNPANGGGDNSDIVTELQALRAEVAALRAINVAIESSARTTSSTLVRVTHGGEAIQTEVYAP